MNTGALAFWTAGLAAALGLGTAAYRADRGLKLALRTAVAHATGVAVDAVIIDEASIGFFGLQVDGLSAGQLVAAHARFVPGLGTLLGGRMDGTLHVEGILIEDPPIGAFDHVSVERADIVLGDQVRVHAHGVTAELGPWARRIPVTVGDVGIEVERRGGAVRRAAFTALSAGPLHDLAGGLHRRDGVVSLTAAAPGVTLLARLHEDGLSASATLDRFALTFDERSLPWGTALGVPSGTLAVTGTATLRVPRGAEDGAEDDAATVEITADATGSVNAPRLARLPLVLDGIAVAANATLDDGTAHLTLNAARAGASIETTFDLVDHDDSGVVATATALLPEISCATLLAAMPEALRPALDGMGLDGTVGGQLTMTLPVERPAQLVLDGALANRCVVKSEPPLADVVHLRTEAPRLPGARDARGQPRVVELGRSNPSYRPLEQMPALVPAIMLQAEDGRFYQHAGVDLAQIGRALSRDLETGTPGAGGSTITQQVAKNLFLSGERTMGRKLEEVVLAWRLEQQLGKRRILELYLNLVELGPGIYGVAEAARAYFHKDLSAVSADEVAQLAALLPAPRRGMDEAWARRRAQLVARLPAKLRPAVALGTVATTGTATAANQP